MVKIDFSQSSTWRGIVMALAGCVGLYLMAPDIVALSASSTTEQVQFFLAKTTALATSIGLVGQTISGLIGTIFSDKGA